MPELMEATCGGRIGVVYSETVDRRILGGGQLSGLALGENDETKRLV